MATNMNRSPSQVGKRFGRLVVQSQYTDGRYSRCICKCDCGNMHDVVLYSLARGASTSCGCYAKESIVARSTTHGHTAFRSRTYRSWISMRIRCFNKSSTGYQRYGGRGISVCQAWDSFAQFLADMGDRPENTTLDRINSDGDYSPENCRWSTYKQQARNKHKSVMLTFNGDIKCVADWAEHLGMSENAIRKRLLLGWSVEKTLTTQVRRRKST
jgi:hypothetical protein